MKITKTTIISIDNCTRNYPPMHFYGNNMPTRVSVDIYFDYSFLFYVCIRLSGLNFWNLNWKCFVFNRGRYWINHRNTTEKRGIVKKETSWIKLRPHGWRKCPLILSCRRFALMFSSFQSLNWWLIFKNLQLWQMFDN